MRYALLVLVATVAAGGCASIAQEAYDEHARAECTEQTEPNARRACFDGVEERSRQRD